MIVADLQQFLGDLARLLNSTDAKKSSAELHQVVAGLDPFKTFSIADFSGFLQLAQTYRQTGKIPDPVKPSPRPKKVAEPNPEHAALRTEVERLYRTAGAPEVTLEMIEEFRPRLKKLKKNDLLDLAKSVELAGMSGKAMPVILESIINRLRSIKQSSMRTSIIDRPGAEY